MRSVEKLKEMEGLAERKAALFGRTLTDAALADEMCKLADMHNERTQSLADLLGEDGGESNEA